VNDTGRIYVRVSVGKRTPILSHPGEALIEPARLYRGQALVITLMFTFDLIL